MSITARYAATCSTCQGRIHPGDQIEWQKGQPVRHSRCPAGTARKAPRISTRSAYPRTAPEPGAHEISGRRTGRSDRRYEVGQVVHAPKVGVVGGGPDGRYYTVLATVLSAPCEDNGEYDWREHAWVRAATDAEAGPVAARVSERETREQLARELNAIRGERVAGSMPATAVAVIPRDSAKLCATGERVAIVDGAILHERVGDPDMMDSWHHYVVRIDDPALVGRVAEYIASQAVRS